MDKTGEPIPEKLVELWERRSEIEALSREVSAIEKKMIELQDEKDPLWIGLNANQAVTLLRQLHQCIGGVRLYAVCITCGGRANAKCAHCKGKGFLSKFQWDIGVDEESKSIRQRARAK